MICGLLGRKLGHSYSPQIHASLGDYRYVLFEKEPEALPEFLTGSDFDCLNVTIPYKKAVIPFCAELSETARRLGAVNTVIRRPDGSLVGHNTDFFGFSSLVARSGLSLKGKKCLVLGSGGASATAVAVLQDLGAKVVVISRSGENHYGNLHLHPDAALIVNATPVGMYPNTGVSPIDLDQFPKLEGALDLIYNPARTRFLLDAQQRGLVTANGLWMLVAQAKESAEWFTGARIDDTCIDQIYRTLKLQMENLVLVGMPGSGKSTVAAALGERLGKKVVDADAEIVAAAGKAIPDIFAEGGEAAFRAIETRVLARLGMQSGLVIATGGGCVTRKENDPLLHQNGTIVWLKRDLDRLPTDGRPLSQSTRLSEMFRIRQPMYQSFADFQADNNGTPEDTVMQICRELEKLQ